MSISIWTDGRVERLKELWASGTSARQIAAELGHVSRNAVIGKVHRLGLASRKTVDGASSIKEVARPLVNTSQRQVLARPTVTVMQGNAMMKVEAQEAQPAASAQVVPIFPRLTLMELQNSSCRWPIGDTMSPEFRFCGAQTENGATYCTYHACLASGAVRSASGPVSGKTLTARVAVEG